MIVILYRMSLPQCLHPDMEHELKMRKSKLSSIICTLSTACHQLATPYLNDVTLWLHRMPYYAMLIAQKTEGLMDCNWVVLMVLSEGQQDPCTIKGQFIPISRNAMV